MHDPSLAARIGHVAQLTTQPLRDSKVKNRTLRYKDQWI